MPSTARAMSLTSPTARTPSAPLAPAPPPMASFFFASDSSRSSRLRSSSSAATRAGTSSTGTFRVPRRRLRICAPDALACLRAALPVSASIRRTPAATPLSPTTEIRPISPVRRTWVPPHSSTDQPMRVAAALAHRDDAHLVAVFLAEQRARAGRDGVVDRHQPRGHRRVLQHDVVGDVLDPLDLLGASSAWDARSRSAAGRARPASPSAPRDRRAPGAAPRAADASPNGSARMALRRA